MTYLVLKFLHVGSMFLATAMAVGPIVVFVLILRSGDAGSIRRAFRFAEPVSRAGGVLYGLGILFGVVAALNGAIDLTSPWLVTAYILIVLLILSNLYADRWMTKVAQASESSTDDTASAELEAWRRSSGPIWSLGAAVSITLAIVFVTQGGHHSGRPRSDRASRRAAVRHAPDAVDITIQPNPASGMTRADRTNRLSDRLGRDHGAIVGPRSDSSAVALDSHADKTGGPAITRTCCASREPNPNILWWRRRSTEAEGLKSRLPKIGAIILSVIRSMVRLILPRLVRLTRFVAYVTRPVTTSMDAGHGVPLA